MTVVILAVPPEQSAALAADLELEGVTVIAVTAPDQVSESELAAADGVVLHADRRTLTALFERLDRASLAAQRRLTVPFLRQVLGAEANDSVMP